MALFRCLVASCCLLTATAAFAENFTKITNPQKSTITTEGQIWHSLVLASGKYVLAGGETQGIQSWKLPSFDPHGPIQLAARHINTLAESPDGKWLAFGYLNKDIKLSAEVAVYDRTARKLVWTTSTAHFDPASMIFTPDNRRLIVGACGYHNSAGAIFVLDVATGKEEHRLERKSKPGTPAHRPMHVALSAKGDYLVSSGYTGEIDIRETRDWTLVKSINAFESSIHGLALSPRDGLVASFAEENNEEDGDSIKFWSIPDGKLMSTVWTSAPVSCVAFTSDGNLMAVGTRSLSRSVMLWNMQTQTAHGALTLSEHYPRELAFVPGTTSLFGLVSRSLVRWDYGWISQQPLSQQIRDHQDPRGMRLRKLLVEQVNATELTLSTFDALHDDDHFRSVAELKNLKTLTLGHLNIQGRGLQLLENCRELKSLNIGAARRIDSLEGLSALEQLETLSLDGCNIRIWKGLEQLTNLKDLAITGSRINGTELTALKSLKNLTKLSLKGRSIDDRESDDFFSGEDLEPLTHLSKLESLKLDGIAIGPNAVPHLRKLEQLRTLDVTGTEIGDSVIQAVERMENLTTAQLGILSNESLVKLSKHPSLTHLYFSGRDINSHGLASLGDSTSLRHLSAWGFWTPYPILDFARDLKTMPRKKILVYDHVRMLQELATDEDSWKSRRQFFAAGGVFTPPMQRDSKGLIIEPSDVRHPKHDEYLAARHKFTETFRDLDDTSVRLSDLRSRSTVLVQEMVKEVFADEPERKAQLLKIIDNIER
jgi:WD40 repeat protein